MSYSRDISYPNHKKQPSPIELVYARVELIRQVEDGGCREDQGLQLQHDQNGGGGKEASSPDGHLSVVTMI